MHCILSTAILAKNKPRLSSIPVWPLHLRQRQTELICSHDHLRGAVRALPSKQCRLIEQLFWQERTETEVAAAIGINQSTINRRKQAILNGLRMKLRDRNEFQKFSA